MFAADLIPTTAHVDEPWIMGYDLYPMETLAFKRAFVREAIDREYLIFFEHDPTIAAGYIREKDGRQATSSNRHRHDVHDNVQIGIIGGSGLYDMAELTDREERTRRRRRSASRRRPYVIGTLRGKRVAFLARHGAGHRLLPSELNFRANIFGFKTLGVEYILSASAVGSLKEEYKPLDLVIPDQFFDRTRGRICTFFGGGLVAHVGFAHPFCAPLSDIAFTVGAGGRRDGAQGRHLRLHGRAAVLDAGRVEAVSLVGHGHHRHDQPAGSQARARGGDLLHDDRARHRLRLLASRPRLRSPST